MEIKVSKKNLKIGFIVVTVIVVLIGLQLLLTSKKQDGTTTCSGNSCSSNQSINNVEKIQVVHFHATQQCWSCITIGEYSEKIIKSSFPEEYKSGKIEYLDININESANSAIVNKFRVSGSSLYINVIADGKDNISEDVTIWNLVSNETKFTTYFKSKLQGYLK